MEDEILTNEETPTTETETEEVVYNCTCEHVDYTEYLETLTQQTEYLASVNTQLYHSNLFIIVLVFAFFLGYLFYKLLKFFM